jgi:hypothetical protein
MHTVYDRIFGDFPAKNTVYTPYIYGSGQPYSFWFLEEFYGTRYQSGSFSLISVVSGSLSLCLRSLSFHSTCWQADGPQAEQTHPAVGIACHYQTP